MLALPEPTDLADLVLQADASSWPYSRRRLRRSGSWSSLRGFAADLTLVQWATALAACTRAALTLLPIAADDVFSLGQLLDPVTAEGRHLRRCIQVAEKLAAQANLQLRPADVPRRIVDELAVHPYDLLALPAEGHGEFVATVLRRVAGCIGASHAVSQNLPAVLLRSGCIHNPKGDFEMNTTTTLCTHTGTGRSIRASAGGATLLVLVLVLAGCTVHPPATRPATRRRTIGVSGTFALFPMVSVWAEAYQKVNPNVRFDVQAGGAGKGMTDVWPAPWMWPCSPTTLASGNGPGRRADAGGDRRRRRRGDTNNPHLAALQAKGLLPARGCVESG